VNLCICILLACIWAPSVYGQSTSPEFQPATITAVAPHIEAVETAGRDVPRYDVSLRAGDTTYVVLYEPPPNSKIVDYTVGQEILVQPGEKTLIFTKMGMSNPTHEVPILRRETVASKEGIDWSRARTEYYSQKLKNLKEKLNLTPEQQAKIKPILEQEAGEISQITFNPVMSDEAKLKQFEKSVRESDEKLKPILTSEQLLKLQEMRAQQKEELKQLLANTRKE
jgi:hypothetical protein